MELVETAVMPSWLEELVVSTYVPSSEVLTGLSTTLVGSEVVACSGSVEPQHS